MRAPKVLDHIKPAHIECEVGDIADTVIVCGDPLRAKWISEEFLENARMVTSLRNMYGYTGYYNGRRISVMGHGMGMPSMSIYAFELFYFFNVKRIIRVGTCGALDESLKINDIIIASDSYTESNFAYSYNGDPTHIAYPDEVLTESLVKNAQDMGLNYHVGSVICTEQFGFYSDNEHVLKRVPKDIVPLGEEMETFALFHIANSFDCSSAAILTVVDSKYSKEFVDADARQNSLVEMIKLALSVI